MSAERCVVARAGVMGSSRFLFVASLAALLTAGGTASASGGLSSITPGTPTQVAGLVAAAPAITSIPKDVVPSVADSLNDDVFRYYPALNRCSTSAVATTTLPKCVFGDTSGTTTIVLWGDSHAYM